MHDMLNEEERMTQQVNVTVGEPFGAGHGAIHASLETQEEYEQLAGDVKNHIAPVAEGAPSSCIDGREAVSCMDGEATEARPGVAGGGLISAYAAAELAGLIPESITSQDNKLRHVHDKLSSAGLVSGGHCDKSNADEGFAAGGTGCGANDRLPQILENLHNDKAVVDGLTSVLMGDGYQAELTEYVNSETLQSRHATWNKTAFINELGAETGHNVEILASEHTPTHGHAEQAVVFNFVENTTVDRDALIEATGKQVFDVDVWYLSKIAAALAADSTDASAESRAMHALVAYQAATYLTLCDGSQRPIIVSAV